MLVYYYILRYRGSQLLVLSEVGDLYVIFGDKFFLSAVISRISIPQLQISQVFRKSILCNQETNAYKRQEQI